MLEKFGLGADDIGIDLGTSSILVYIRGKGVVLGEPTVVAYDKDTNEIKAMGEEASLMIGRTPGNIAAIRPLHQGVISDYTVTEKMLRYFMHKALGRKALRRPRVCICIPSGATEVEKRAVVEAAMEAGARDVLIIPKPIAAALGAGIDISKPSGNMIIDIGGGTTDAAVISLGEAVVSASIKVAGDDFDEALVRYMRRKYNMLIGERTAEELKRTIGSVYPGMEIRSTEVAGRNLMTGMPMSRVITSEETEEAFADTMQAIITGVGQVLEQTPPELAADIAQRGILLSGGGSLIYGLEPLLEEQIGIRTMTVDDPLSVVAIGTGRYAEYSEQTEDRG